MIVLDTHAWLWWVAAPEKLSSQARNAIDLTDALGVATISCWEIAMLTEAGRIDLDRDVEAWIRQALTDVRIQAMPLTSDIALRAALLGRAGFQGDPADRIVYATAREAGADLVTKDRALRAFDPRGTVW
ncbi:MAG TPA: type II toxin-antitoxin system VapC family toxin [Solirubrobacteraceae bacterium]|nr:type II toxin-antitoxin system VapC family toxin [Solirubrobacteraceae bacterium]